MFLFACDRCGAIMRRHEDRYVIQLAHIDTPEERAERNDLCPNCRDSYYAWRSEMPARDANLEAVLSDEG